MQVVDASSMILAWDNYPIGQIPKLWDWLASEIESEDLVIPLVALDEVIHKVPECGSWLTDSGCKVVKVTNQVLQIAVQIKNILGITNDNYHPKGVDENDLLIIATAKTIKADLLSDENRQQILPPEKRRYKIPAVCGLPKVDVSCIKFIEYFKGSGRVV
jgi:hypothetical protein